MDFKKELVKAKDIQWISRDTLPKKDYNHAVLVQFNDGHLDLSDAGTVHDDTNISLWKEPAA